jgi:uncharacterized membrane protein
MRVSPILAFHICSGVLGLLAGAVAICARKGSHLHKRSGNVFVLSMLGLAGSGICLALAKSETGNMLGGALTFYLVATAWMTARRRDLQTGLLDWAAMLIVAGVAGFTLTYAIEATRSPSHMVHEYTAGPYLFLGSVAAVALAGDVRLLIEGGIAGTRRVARHLWRMCLALFIASASIFLARQQVFPTVLRRTGVLFVLSFLPLLLMAFWLVRVRLTRARSHYVPARDFGSPAASTPSPE